MKRGEEIALQVSCDHDKLKAAVRKGAGLEIGNPPADHEVTPSPALHRLKHGVGPSVDAEDPIALRRQRLRMAPPAHCDIERSSWWPQPRRKAAGPPNDEGRRWIGTLCISHTLHVAQALLTAVGLGLLGVIATAIIGLQGSDLSRHISFGIFSTMITLLAHSMMMFYFIGKGRAVKDALTEAGHTPDSAQFRAFVGRISQARKPVFSIGPLAMVATIIAALLGASADTRVLPPIVHATIAYGAVACQLAAIKVELDAIGESSRVVDEVNRLIGS